MKTVENINFTFTPEFEITESKEGGAWLTIGGTALVEGVSRNNNNYSKDNLMENDNKSFKWLVGHPSDPEEHVVGKGRLKYHEGKLLHEGKIRNTARHPDIIEKVRDGFLGPSIHATCKKATRDEEGMYHVEGLSIDGVGLVAFQGVKDATIDYALAESFNKAILEKKEVEVPKMAEQTPPVQEAVAVKPAEPVPVVENEEVKKLKEELAALKLKDKTVLVESITALNNKLNKEELMKESEDKLKLIKEYEQKLAEKVVKSAAIVEEPKMEKKSQMIVEDKVGLSLGKEAYEQFNADIRNKIR